MMDGDKIQEALDNLRMIVKSIVPKEITLHINHEIISQIGTFLGLPCNPVVSRTHNGKILRQELTCTSLGELFQQEFDNEHIHTTDGHRCSFHQESLFSHQVMAMLIALDHSREEDDHLQFIYGLTALLHDVGKKAVVSIFKKIGATGFPFHGEMGSMILQGLYNPEAHSIFVSQEEWEGMCRAISVHMCGYHETSLQKEDTGIKWNQLRLETDFVKQILVILSIADTFAAYPDDETRKQKENYTDFMESRRLFKVAIGQPYNHNLFNRICAGHGALFSVLGMSGSGKSTMIQNLIDLLISFGIPRDRIVIVERDMFMVKLVAQEKSWPIPKVRPNGQEYAKFFAEYVGMKNMKIGQRVNEEMKKMIVASLRRGDIIILDTVATLFGDYVYPGGKGLGTENELLINATKISIYVNRTTLATETDATKNGHTLDEQVTLMGECGVADRLPPGIGRPAQLKMLESLMTSRQLKEDCVDCSKRTRPHMTFTVSWSDVSTFGTNSMTHVIKQLVQYLVSEKVVLEKTQMDIRQLMEAMWDEYDGDFEKISVWFNERGFQMKTLLKNTPEFGKIFSIGYKDGLCYEWSERWCRQCRGVIVYVEDGNVSVLSRKLQRGAEILTGTHLEKQVTETQEIGGKREHRFDTVQKYTIEQVRNGAPISGFLTSKVDGSLLAVNLYRWNTSTAKMIWNLILKYADEFTKAVAYASRTSPYLVVMSTQNTFFHADIMHAYNTTALAVGLGVYTEEEIRQMATTKKPEEIIGQVVRAFIDRLIKFYNSMPKDNQSDAMTLSFETICANRTSAWGDKHTELALSYPNSGFYFLGVTCGLGSNSGYYLPHFAVSDAVRIANFSEPHWWKIENASEIAGMLNIMEGILTGINTEAQFMRAYPPSGGTLGRWDYEGFVFFTDARTVPGYNGNQEMYDYSKVKTPTYYICHKLKDAHILKLSQLPAETQARFPLAFDVANFFNDLEEKLVSSVSSLLEILTDAVNNLDHDLVKQLQTGPKKGFVKADRNIKMRILCATLEIKLAYPHFVKYFPDLPETAENVLRSIIMTVVPWSGDWKNKIATMVHDRDEKLRKLFSEIRERPVV